VPVPHLVPAITVQPWIATQSPSSSIESQALYKPGLSGQSAGSRKTGPWSADSTGRQAGTQGERLILSSTSKSRTATGVMSHFL